MRVDGKSFIVTPDVVCSGLTCAQPGNSSICAWPPLSCSRRVLSSPTYVQVTLFRYGLPFCQYLSNLTSLTSLPFVQWSHLNGPVPTGAL